MPHTYTFREQADSTWKITQHAMQGGTYTRDESYPDVVLALSENGEPRITRINYVAPSGPTVEERKATMIAEAKQATIDAFNAGFTTGGYTYDFCGGERAAENWLGYCAMCTDVLMGVLPAEMMKPALTKDGISVPLTASEGKSLFWTLAGMRIAVTDAEVAAISAINACSTHAELDALGA